MERAELYRDIAKRTQGDIYIGVVGPVRTGKSTFIKRFMDLLVVPNIENEHVRERLVDELPQSGSGKTIMTPQPKFVPNEACELTLDDTMGVRVRRVDCVGYMVEGAIGHTENESARMVRTPWFDYDIPFDEAAEIGTKKVITEHSTIGIVMTTDGSISGIDREAYAVCEERVVRELQGQGKPFIVVLNSIHPEDPDTVSLCEKLSERYGAVVKPSDVLNMGIDEINGLLESLLAEFPIKLIRIDTPSWIRALGPSHWLTKEALDAVSECAGRMAKMRDYSALTETLSSLESFKPCKLVSVEPGSGTIAAELVPQDNMFYTVLGEQCGFTIENDFQLISTLKEFSHAKREYDKISVALDSALRTGYGMVAPEPDAMVLDEPEIVQQGSRFGVKLKAKASGLHLIRVDIESEVSPLVGTEEQSEEFMQYLLDTFEKEPTKIWQTNIFGKPLYDLVKDGMAGKINRMPEAVQMKLQSTVQRMVNDGCNGLICIML